MSRKRYNGLTKDDCIILKSKYKPYSDVANMKPSVLNKEGKKKLYPHLFDSKIAKKRINQKKVKKKGY